MARDRWIECGVFLAGILGLAWAIGPWSAPNPTEEAIAVERQVLAELKREDASFRLTVANAQVDFLKGVSDALGAADRECAERHLVPPEDANDRDAVATAILGYRACMHRFILELAEARRAEGERPLDP